MLGTRQIEISEKHPLAAYYGGITHQFKNMRNVTNFYIRNTATGILKSPDERTANETEVLHYVFTGLQEANRRAAGRLSKKVLGARAAADALGGMAGAFLMHEALKNIVFFEYPTIHRRFLNYGQLDAIFKCTKNADYYALPSQVNQQAIKRTVKSWASYWGGLKARRENPAAFTGPVHFPGYIKENRSTAHFTTQVCKPSLVGGQLMLSFPGGGLALYCGKGILPEQVIKTEVSVYHSGYRVLVTYDDGLGEPVLPEAPGRLLGLDTGVSNFLTGVFNFRHAPFIVSGGWLKSQNQWFNKEKARLTSELARGGHGIRETHRMEALSVNRERGIRDLCYKTAHYICRLCQAETIRGGILSIDDGQTGAAKAIGMTRVQTMVNVILPQALYNIMPQIGNNLIINIKDASVLSIIGIAELFYTTKGVTGNYYTYFEAFTIAMVVYFILTFAYSRLLRLLERKMSGPVNYDLATTDTLAHTSGLYSYGEGGTRDER